MRWGLLLMGVALGRRLTGSFTVSPLERDERVQYISKFACSIGECKYNVRAGIKNPASLLNKMAKMPMALARTKLSAAVHNSTARMMVRVVLDEEWDRSHKSTPCQRAELGRGRTSVQIPLDGSMGPWASNSFRQSHRPHFWYFFAEDCRNSIASQLSKIPATEGVTYTSQQVPPFDIMYEIEMIQVDGGHLSFEYYGMLKWSVLHILTYGGIMAFMFWKQLKTLKSQRFQLHIMTQILNASCLCYLMAGVFSIINLIKANSTGSTFPVLETVAESSNTLSHIAVSSCLILIALGVTLNAPQQMPMNVIYGLASLIAGAHMLVVIIDKMTSDSRYKYYGVEGAVGWILVAFRLALCAIFVLCWQQTRTDPRTPGATERFLRRILLPAVAYFMAFPGIMLLTAAVRPYWRHAFHFHASFIVHTIAVVWLSEVFLSKGEYFKVSQMSQSFLPGGVWKPAAVIPHHID